MAICCRMCFVKRRREQRRQGPQRSEPILVGMIDNPVYQGGIAVMIDGLGDDGGESVYAEIADIDTADKRSANQNPYQVSDNDGGLASSPKHVDAAEQPQPIVVQTANPMYVSAGEPHQSPNTTTTSQVSYGVVQTADGSFEL